MHLPPGVLKISPPTAGQNAGVGLTGLLGRDHVSSFLSVCPTQEGQTPQGGRRKEMDAKVGP